MCQFVFLIPVTADLNQAAVSHVPPLCLTGSSSHQKHRDMQYVQMMKSKWMLKVGMSHNATKQTHFRVQVMF